MEIARVRWLDSCGINVRSAWRNRDDAEALEPISIESVGFLVSETDQYVTLVAHLTEMDQIQGEMCIPRACIVSLEVLGRCTLDEEV